MSLVPTVLLLLLALARVVGGESHATMSTLAVALEIVLYENALLGGMALPRVS